jgi:hypothetical protein
VLRDQLGQLKWLQRRIQQLASSRRKLDGVWKMPGFDRQEHWMILRAGQLLECVNGSDGSKIFPRISDAKASDPDVPQTHLQIHLLLLLSSWIKKHPGQTGGLTRFDQLTSPNSAA